MFEALYCETRLEAPLRNRLGVELAANPGKKLEAIALSLSLNLQSMAIYRWAEAALVLDPMHPLCPLYWQLFFSLFFASLSVTLATGTQATRHYGHSFFRGRPHEGMLNRLYEKTRVNAAHFRSLVAASASDTPLEPLQHHGMLVSLYTSFGLWLSEGRLRGADVVDVSSLPAEFDVPRLVGVMYTDPCDTDCGTTSLWHGLVQPPPTEWLTQQQQRPRQTSKAADAVLGWLPTEPLPVSQSEGGSTRQSNLLANLSKMNSAEPAPGPAFATPPPFQRVLNVAQLNDADLPILILQDSMDIIIQSASDHVRRSATHVALDLEYTEELPRLYVNDTVASDLAKRCSRGDACIAAAVFRFEVPQRRTIHEVEAKLGHTKDAIRDLLSGGSLPPSFCTCVLLHKQVISDLLEAPTLSPESIPARAAVKLFFSLVERFNPECLQFAPANQLLNHIIPELGVRFIQGNRAELDGLITAALRRRHLHHILVPLLQPDPRSGSFMALYQQAAEQADAAGGQCVSAILRQFSMHAWLQVERSSSER